LDSQSSKEGQYQGECSLKMDQRPSYSETGKNKTGLWYENRGGGESLKGEGNIRKSKPPPCSEKRGKKTGGEVEGK